MPGPVSDSYDPEFGTGERAGDVADAITKVRDRLNSSLGKGLLDIVDVAQSKNGKVIRCGFSERELRIIRFCLNRALETI